MILYVMLNKSHVIKRIIGLWYCGGIDFVNSYCYIHNKWFKEVPSNTTFDFWRILMCWLRNFLCIILNSAWIGTVSCLLHSFLLFASGPHRTLFAEVPEAFQSRVGGCELHWNPSLYYVKILKIMSHFRQFWEAEFCFRPVQGLYPLKTCPCLFHCTEQKYKR